MTFKDSEEFEIWKNDLIAKHIKKGFIRYKTDTESILNEQFQTIENLNAIIQANEKSKEQELKKEQERLKQEQERIIEIAKANLQIKSREYIFKREGEIKKENDSISLWSKIKDLTKELEIKAKQIADYLLEITNLEGEETITKRKARNILKKWEI